MCYSDLRRDQFWNYKCYQADLMDNVSIIESSIILGVFWLISFDFSWEKLCFCKILTLSQGHSSQWSTQRFVCGLVGIG